MTFPDIFDVKMLIVANIFKDFHHHHPSPIYCGPRGALCSFQWLASSHLDLLLVCERFLQVLKHLNHV